MIVVGNALIDAYNSWCVLWDIANVEGEGLFAISVIDFESISEIGEAHTSESKHAGPNHSLRVGFLVIVLCSQGIAYGDGEWFALDIAYNDEIMLGYLFENFVIFVIKVEDINLCDLGDRFDYVVSLGSIDRIAKCDDLWLLECKMFGDF